MGERDPLVLGQPCGYALFKPSVNGCPDVPNEEALLKDAFIVELIKQIRAHVKAWCARVGHVQRRHITRADVLDARARSGWSSHSLDTRELLDLGYHLDRGVSRRVSMRPWTGPVETPPRRGGGPRKGPAGNRR